jgi:hypothetical protein
MHQLLKGIGREFTHKTINGIKCQAQSLLIEPRRGQQLPILVICDPLGDAVMTMMMMMVSRRYTNVCAYYRSAALRFSSAMTLEQSR